MMNGMMNPMPYETGFVYFAPCDQLGWYYIPVPVQQYPEPCNISLNKMAEEVAQKVQEWNMYLKYMKEVNTKLLERHRRVMKDYFL